MTQKVLVIVGPTASGKSDLAVRLAKELHGEVISADSRQVYKGLNVGAGKITKKEMRGVPHYLLGIANPKKLFSAAEWKTHAEKALQKIEIKGKLPIIVGGTGFYIDALTQNLPAVPPNLALRKKLEKLSNTELFEILEKKDIRRAKNIDKHNKVRLIRALEIIESIGSVPVVDTKKSDFLWIGLLPKDLEAKIYKRLIERLPKMLKEVKKLHEKGLSWKRMEELGLEYKFLALYFQKKLTKPELTEKLFTAIRQYSRRQLTWFKRNKSIHWFESASDAFDTTLKLRAQVTKR